MPNDCKETTFQGFKISSFINCLIVRKDVHEDLKMRRILQDLCKVLLKIRNVDTVNEHQLSVVVRANKLITVLFLITGVLLSNIIVDRDL